MTDRHADFAEHLRSDLDAFSRRFAGELSSSASAALGALRTRCAAGREPAAVSAPATGLRGDSLAMIVAELDECRRAQTVLMDNLPGMVYRCRNDPEWTMEFVSPGCAELTGYTPEELTRSQGMSYGRLIHPDDRQQVWDTVQRSIRSMQPFVVGYRIITRGGEVKWVRERGRGVYAGGQYLQALEGVVTDISEQQRAQEETRRSAAYFRALIEHAFEAIFVIHPGGAIQYVSPSVETMLGYSVGELVGRDILGLVHTGDQAAARDGIEGVVTGTRTEPLEVRLLARGGSVRVVRVVGTNLVDDPTVGGVIVNARDVTERRALSQRQAVEHAATALLTQSTRVEQAIPRILPMLAEGLGWDAATFWMVDDTAELLQWEAEWHRPELADCGLLHLGRQVVFLPGVGLPGRVWARREPLWIERLDESPDLPRSKAAAGDGISTGFAVPVVAGDRCFGVLELMCCAPRSPEHSLIQSVATIGSVLGQFISRIQAEEALRASERYFRSLTENALDVITVLDDRGRIRYKSPAVTLALGYTPEELLGRDVFSLLHPADVDRAREVFGDAVRNPRVPHALEVRFRHSDGRWRSLALILASLLDDPAVAGVVANSRDITEQKLAEAQLRRTHETLTALVRNAPLAIVAVDDRFNVIMWNPAAERIFGWTTEEVFGKPYPIVPPDRVQEFERFRDAIFIDGRGLDGVELVRRRKDGTEADVFCQSVILSDAMGHPASAVGFFTDISERKYLQEQLRQSQKMEAIGRLAGGIAHDFNNLLTAIKGGAQLALMEVPVGTPLREDLEEIDAVADRAAALTRQLLAFSRKQVLRPEILDLGEVARRLEPMLRRLIHEEIELVTVVDPRAGTVLADAGQMEQILVNLALNARDAMPEGGRLTIEVRRAVFPTRADAYDAHEEPGGPAVLLTVRDTGTGMDTATQERIFEPFFSTKEPGKGTGLGLATVYGIVRQSGGYISVDSKVGKGTRARIYLPEADGIAATPEPAPPASSAAVGGSETILLVEDERSVRELSARILSTAGYTVIVASDGEQAWQLAETLDVPPDILVTDVVMPRMGGRELAERLCARWEGLRVLYLSGYSEDVIAHHGVLNPGVHLLEKPFAPADLLRATRAVLEAGRRDA